MHKLFLVGDTHLDIDLDKLKPENFPVGQTLTKEDIVIILGDVGLTWNKSDKVKSVLKWFNDQPWTTLFIDGNHENFDILDNYPVSKWNGGNVHKLANSVYHLMRGQVFTINNQTFFTMGGGESVDKIHRTEFISWWSQETPNNTEINTAYENLEKHDNIVDFVLTHVCPASVVEKLSFPPSTTEIMLEELMSEVTYKQWFCGHMHIDQLFMYGKLRVLYDDIVEITQD